MPKPKGGVIAQRASAAALFDFAIELSYGDPGETKRLRT
jgi:hypothetical protein